MAEGGSRRGQTKVLQVRNEVRMEEECGWRSCGGVKEKVRVWGVNEVWGDGGGEGG